MYDKAISRFSQFGSEPKTNGNNKSLRRCRHRADNMFRKQALHVKRNLATRSDLRSL
jgi:hypothetical protein